MAPSKPKAPKKPVSGDRVGNDAKVSKRPQRGFHRYKDGTLNVKPKNKAEIDKSVTQAVMLQESRFGQPADYH